MNDGCGSFLVPNTPLRMKQADASIKSKVSTLGQDNESILQAWLDMSANEIDSLTQQGVLFKPKPRS